MALELFSYPDQLIGETFSAWAENVLGGARSGKIADTFQEAVGSTNSNDRSRAKELVQLGLLKGRLVNSRVGARGDQPLGWQLVQQGDLPLSKLGCTAYTIGHSIKIGTSSNEILTSFSSLCVFFLLQLGAPLTADVRVTIFGLFEYILNTFKVPNDIPELKWKRYVAAAMFCTIDSEKYNGVLKNYISGQPVDHLYLISEKSDLKVTPDILRKTIQGGFSLSDPNNAIKPNKDSLFWLGSEKSENRGVYSQAFRYHASLLKSLAEFEATELSKNGTSPFASLMEKSDSGEIPCAIDLACTIIAVAPSLGKDWRLFMSKLYKGAVEAMNFIRENSDTTADFPNLLFAHGAPENIPTDDTFEVELEKKEAPIPLKEKDKVVIAGRAFLVKSVREEGQNFVIVVESTTAGAQTSKPADSA